MPLSMLEHCAIRAHDLERTKDFYVDVLGLEIGARPPFPFPGYWLYCNGIPVIPLFGGSDGKAALDEYLGVEPEGSTRTGAVDHLAFVATGLAEFRARLEKHGVERMERVVPEQGMLQMFVEDPNGVRVELDFAQEEIEAAA